MARQQWQPIITKLIKQVAICLITEVLLDLTGLDMLANYNEFIESEMMVAINSHMIPTIVISQAACA
jgi:hypothetical protein